MSSCTNIPSPVVQPEEGVFISCSDAEFQEPLCRATDINTQLEVYRVCQKECADLSGSLNIGTHRSLEVDGPKTVIFDAWETIPGTKLGLYTETKLNENTPLRVADGTLYTGPDIYGALDREGSGEWNVATADESGLRVRFQVTSAGHAVAGLFLLKQDRPFDLSPSRDMFSAEGFVNKIQNLSKGTMRFVIEEGGKFYISEPSQNFAAGPETGYFRFSFSLNALRVDWFDYKPTISADSVSKIGALVNPSFQNIGFLGFTLFATAENLPDTRVNYGVRKLTFSGGETYGPSEIPSETPSVTPTIAPSVEPSTTPSVGPSLPPSLFPTSILSPIPSTRPSAAPSASPAPTIRPTTAPTRRKVVIYPFPTHSFTWPPVSSPPVFTRASVTNTPTAGTSSAFPSSEPTWFTPSAVPTPQVSFASSTAPSMKPSVTPSVGPSLQPSFFPTSIPTTQLALTMTPSKNPSFAPSTEPAAGETPTSLPTEGLTTTAPSHALVSSQEPTAMSSAAPYVVTMPTIPNTARPVAPPPTDEMKMTSPPSVYPSSAPVPSESRTLFPTISNSVAPSASVEETETENISTSPSASPFTEPMDDTAHAVSSMLPTLLRDPELVEQVEELRTGEVDESLDSLAHRAVSVVFTITLEKAKEMDSQDINAFENAWENHYQSFYEAALACSKRQRSALYHIPSVEVQVISQTVPYNDDGTVEEIIITYQLMISFEGPSQKLSACEPSIDLDTMTSAEIADLPMKGEAMKQELTDTFQEDIPALSEAETVPMPVQVQVPVVVTDEEVDTSPKEGSHPVDTTDGLEWSGVVSICAAGILFLVVLVVIWLQSKR